MAALILNCTICLDSMQEPRQLQCGHQFCSPCIDETVRHGHFLCPTCRQPFKPILGSQPAGGVMSESRSQSSLPGYPGCGTITISYTIPSGIQVVGHPNPGHPYSGTSRVAYLPDNADGNDVLRLLRRAFEARIIFTVGRSVTSGCDNMVTWNDIHHKTSTSGGR